MILYHGTNVEFDTIDLAKSKPNKDFGQGFSLLPIMNRPWLWQESRWSS